MSLIPCVITLKYCWVKILLHKPFKPVIIFQVDIKVSEIFADFSREKITEKFHPLTLIGQKLMISRFWSEISDVHPGCSWEKQNFIYFYHTFYKVLVTRRVTLFFGYFNIFLFLLGFS